MVGASKMNRCLASLTQICKKPSKQHTAFKLIKWNVNFAAVSAEVGNLKLYKCAAIILKEMQISDEHKAFPGI